MEQRAGLRRALGFRDLTLFGLICIAPVAAFTLFGFIDAAADGAVVAPYVLGAIGLSLTALSYAAMAEVAPQAGSIYGFARLAMGRFVGFLGGWAIMLDYVVITALTLLYGALYLNSVVPAVPVEAIMAVFLVAMLVVNLLGIHWAVWADTLLTALQIGVGLVFVAAAIAVLLTLPGGGLTTIPLWPPGATLGGVVAATPIAVIAFLGFDAISTLAEEVRGDAPGRLVGRAMLTTLAVMVVLFVVVSWLLALLERGVRIADPSTAAIDIVAARIGWLAAPLALVVALAFWAAITATHAGVARLGFGMARAGELPGVLARVDARRQVPTASVILYALLIAAVGYVALPNVYLLSGLVSFGALTGFILVNVSVIVHFGLRGGSRRWFGHWLAPGAGTLVLLWVLSGLQPMALWVGVGWLVAGCLWYAARHFLAGRWLAKSGVYPGTDID